ncbi:hypothetical protein BO79DRAFT_212114 [Aspergillus costaricaensis CBS 115574]|uniref:Uncharacterized protein n=1 Tax=Aspergillus costaricaensis CBS 115574 TaxID=1448317 RepID=A0ACD1HY00_9EURO|nr:hypothetical protein BO79DRAFT_212114 [Aspergillus costaricaensis CBS 115574]RAK83113.1 hypothetical protein BO79DRAFT_212114 [Aspergillus costaricaensis CBS 115574]
MLFNKSLLATTALSLFTSSVVGQTIRVSYGSPLPTDDFSQVIELDELVALDHPGDWVYFFSSQPCDLYSNTSATEPVYTKVIGAYYFLQPTYIGAAECFTD